MEPAAVLECRGIWKVFGPKPERIVGTAEADLPRAELEARTNNVAAVRDISFSVGGGELFVVMGLSGSGKSTLVRCLSRLIEPTAGAVLIDGEDLTAATTQRAAMTRAKKSLQTVVDAAVKAHAGMRAVSVFPALKGEQAVAEITLDNNGTFMTFSEPLE